MADLTTTDRDERPDAPAILAAGDQDLRLALAMRGGVSLAVWIGGACDEITGMRASAGGGTGAGHGSSEFYRRLLRVAGYGSVAIDVMAGASAGGLNGAILAASLVYGFPFSEMRETWINVASLTALLRDPGERNPPSLLMGDEYFLPELTKKLADLIGPGHHTATPGLDLYLAATLVQPRSRRIQQGPGEYSDEAERTAVFRFRSRGDADWLTDFPAGDGAKATAGRLALAGRTTSSFPGAFEPATVVSNRPRRLGEGPLREDDMFGIFSAAGPGGGEGLRVFDGGVLDNIPVARAIRAVGAAPGEAGADRFLLYLHPSPAQPKPPKPPAGRGAVGRLVGWVFNHVGEGSVRGGLAVAGTVSATLSAKLSAETIADDMDVLEAQNEAARRSLLTRQAVLSPFRSAAGGPGGIVDAIVAAASDRIGSYWVVTAGAEADRLTRLLQSPVAALGEDPFTKPEHTNPLHEWEPRHRERLRAELAVAVLAHPGAAAPTGAVTGPGPLLRTSVLLIEWADNLSRWSPGAREPAGRVRQKLQGIRLMAELLVEHESIAWVLAAHEAPGGDFRVDAWVGSTVGRVGELVRWFPAELVDAVRAGIGTAELGGTGSGRTGMLGESEEASATSLRNALLERVRAIEELRPAPAEDHFVADDLYETLWAALGDHVATLATLAGGEAADDPLDACLRAAGSRDPAARVELLKALDVVLVPVHVSSLTAAGPIRYRRIAGTNRTPLASWFPKLLTSDQPVPQDTIPVKNKLAGNALANFAAFIRPDWRANDWMWGRADAATTLVDLLVDGDRLAARRAQLGDGAAIREIVTRPPVPRSGEGPESVAEWAAFYETLWTPDAENQLCQLLDSSADVPDLADVRRALLARRQWEVVREQLPMVPGTKVTGNSPGALQAAMRDYDVGAQPALPKPRTIGSLTVIVKLYVLAWRVLLPSLGQLVQKVSAATVVALLAARAVLSPFRLACHVAVCVWASPRWYRALWALATIPPLFLVIGLPSFADFDARTLALWLLIAGIGTGMHATRSPLRMLYWLGGWAAVLYVLTLDASLWGRSIVLAVVLTVWSAIFIALRETLSVSRLNDKALRTVGVAVLAALAIVDLALLAVAAFG